MREPAVHWKTRSPLRVSCGGAPVLLVDQMAAGAFLYQSVITWVRCTTFC